MYSKRCLLTSIIVVFSNDEQPLGDNLSSLWMYWTDKNNAFMYGSPNSDRRCLCMGFHIWTMPEIIRHTRLIINDLIGKTIINYYYQLLPINNNDGKRLIPDWVLSLRVIHLMLRIIKKSEPNRTNFVQSNWTKLVMGGISVYQLFYLCIHD